MESSAQNEHHVEEDELKSRSRSFVAGALQGLERSFDATRKGKARHYAANSSPARLPDSDATKSSSFDDPKSDNILITAAPEGSIKDETRRTSEGSTSNHQKVKNSLRRRAASLQTGLGFGKLRAINTDIRPSIRRRGSAQSSASSSLRSLVLTEDIHYVGESTSQQVDLPKEAAYQARDRLDSVSETNSVAAVPGLLPRLPVSQSAPQVSPLVKSRKMAAPRQSSSLLDPAAASRRQQMTEQKARTQKLAADEEAFIREKMRAKGTEHLFPKYRFVDFIGKGTYGRVYQAYDLNLKPPREVAIKLMNVDDVDYQANAIEKDESVNDIRKEIQVLMQLKEHKAKNVNLIHDVLEVDGQLWLVCDYCPGGSLRTLLRASGGRCEEKYIKVIVRELAIGLQAIHEANIIHRDLKAANVMIHEKGGLQIIDFGVAGIVESKIDKRGTIIGTPYWMPPEQHKATRANNLQYGFEVDVWSYIVTIYEIANGAPPHSHLPPNRLAAALRSRPPRLTEDEFSRELCEFVEFVAQAEPQNRPSIADILDHPYVRGSEKTHPTTLLKDLVDKFMNWTFAGGQRTSLFVPHGAQAASEFAATKSDNVDFIFSTSRDMMAEFDPSYDDSFINESPEPQFVPAVQVSTPSGAVFVDALDDFANEPPDDYTSRPTRDSSAVSGAADQHEKGKERRVARGGHALESIFDKSQRPYEYGIRSGEMPLDKPILSRAKSDLPLRNTDDCTPHLARKEVDVSDTSSSKSDVELANADTIKQKRKQQGKEKRETMNMGWQPDWSNLHANADGEAEPVPAPPSAALLARPPLVHAETAPDKISQARASTATMNLDDLMGDDDWVSSSAIGRVPTLSSTQEDDEDEDTSRSNLNFTDSGLPSPYASSLADTSASEDERSTFQHVAHPALHQNIAPPLPAAMLSDAPPELVQSELSRLLQGFQGELSALAAAFPTEEDIEKEYVDGESEAEMSDDGFAEE